MLRLHRGGAGFGKGLSHMHVCSASCGRDPTPTDLLTTSRASCQLPVLANKLRLSFSNHLGTVRAVPSPFSLSLWLATGYIDYFISSFPNLKFICQNELSKAKNKRQDRKQRRRETQFRWQIDFPTRLRLWFCCFLCKDRFG